MVKRAMEEKQLDDSIFALRTRLLASRSPWLKEDAKRASQLDKAMEAEARRLKARTKGRRTDDLRSIGNALRAWGAKPIQTE